MNYNSYEEYMNSLLGKKYNMEMKTTNNNDIINDEMENIEEIISNETDINEDNITYYLENKDYEDFYPDIYKIIYPVIYKKCINLNEEISKDLLDNITNEVYNIVEKEENEKYVNKLNYNNYKNYRNFRHINKSEDIYIEKNETRQKNFLLNDLIKILVLRELIGNGKRKPCPSPHRPPINPIPGNIIPPPIPPRPNNKPPKF